MKKISIYLLLLVSISSIGQTITNGFVKYKMTSDNEQMAMMGDVFMTNYFDKENIAMEVDMMNGMVVTKIYKKINDPKSTKMTMNAMGQKYEISGIDENASKGVDMADLDNIVTVKVDKANTKEILIATYDAFFGLLIPVIIVGGIRFGIFTPTEAGAIAVAYSLIIGFFVHKEIKLKSIPLISKFHTLPSSIPVETFR